MSRTTKPTGPALLAAALLTITAAWPALAERPIDETRKVDRDATITIDNLAGSVTVTGWNRGEVAVTGTLDDKAEELRITGGGKKLAIEVKYPEKVRNIKKGSRLEIKVPAGSTLEIETVSADIAVDGCKGAVHAEAVSGDVILRGEPATVSAETISGTLDLDVRTDRADLSCVSGEIVARGVRRELSCSVISGTIRIDAGEDLARLSGEAVSGDVSVEGRPADGARWNLSSHSGNVKLALSGKIDAEFRLKTFSGSIADAFGHQAERTSRFAPGKELSFTEGGGGARVEVDVFSGDIEVTRR
jgi:DUF4097 and DUF4098 domain-containing protein YvlB